MVVASGDLIKQEFVDASQTKKRVQYKLTIPTIASAIGLAVGPFEVYPDPKIPAVTHFCLPGKLKQLKHIAAGLDNVIGDCRIESKRTFCFEHIVFVANISFRSSKFSKTICQCHSPITPTNKFLWMKLIVKLIRPLLWQFLARICCVCRQ